MTELDIRRKGASTMTPRELQNKLLLWESADNPLAPLTDSQKEGISDIEALLNELSDGEVETENNEDEIKKDDIKLPVMENTLKFLEWYEELVENEIKNEDEPYETYNNQLDERRKECNALIELINQALQDLGKLSKQYEQVSDKTSALHVMSEQLIADQTKLSAISEDVKQKLYYFSQVEQINQRLSSTTMSVNSEQFFTLLSRIDECLDYMRSHKDFKESHSYIVKYRHSLTRAISLIHSYVMHVLNQATEQVLAPKVESETEPCEGIDTAYAVYFGKFQAAAPKLRPVVKEVEDRIEKNDEYSNLLSEIQKEYINRRGRVSGAGARAALEAGVKKRASDICALLRSSIALLAHAARDEWALHRHFFELPSPALEEYLQNMCNGLYETMRPLVIHINHLETLAEICSILRIELLEEQVNNEPETLAALGRAGSALLQDCQERLVFRAHVHLRADVLNYKPAPGDLAYPDKLIMMEQIALSIQDSQLKRSDSHNSMVSDISSTSQEVANINVEAQRRPQGSPADLHGMWYPGVRRTLATLSRLYRCVERRVFQGLAQEAISLCVASVSNAHQQIAALKTQIDGELFEIKHLLILREQIAPFQVDFIVKETSLDFSNMKNAAYSLLQKRNRIFTLGSNNALLEFLLDGTPMVKEHLLDSKKEVDRQLKSCCEDFIKDSTDILAAPLIAFLEKTKTLHSLEHIRKEPWATPEQLAAIITDTQRRIKQKLAPIQRSMQLYLANKETEFILFRPIRNNVVGYFVQMEQFLTNAGYSYDDMLIISCPTPEQIAVFISSASLLSMQDQVAPYGQSRRKTSSSQRPSVAKIPENIDEATNVN